MAKLFRILATSAWLVAVPVTALAQSAINGVVRDASGGVLPGVTVEAASEALIERVRTAVTDDQGLYRLLDLRPGTYTLTFSLPGFNNFKREGLQLAAEFTATINAELSVGALEETVTVTGESPVVDITSAARSQVLDREAIDSIPTGRSIQGMAQLVPGVSLNLPDTGGARAMQQTYMTVRGMTTANTTMLVDGMLVNGLQSDGAVQSYFNDAMNQEVSIQTSGISADTSAGGVRMNMIPRDGGNRFSGDFKVAYRPGDWQSDNLTQRHIDRGLTNGNAIDRIVDTTLALGGPIMRDRLWFFAAGRYFSVNNYIANTVTDDGGRGLDDQFIKSGMARLTWQISPSSKLSGYFDEIDKYRGHDMQSNEDPEEAALQWFSPAYHTAAVEVHRHADQRAAARGRVFAQPRVLHQQLPGRRRPGARHPRVVRRRVAARERPERPPRRRHLGEHAEPGAALRPGGDVLHVALAQLQGRRPAHLRRLLAHGGRQRRPDAAVPQQRHRRALLGARQRGHPQHPAQVRRAAQPRPRASSSRIRGG